MIARAYNMVMWVVAVIALMGAYAVWRHEIKTADRAEQRAQRMERSVEQLRRVHDAERDFRRDLRARPDSLRDDDGHRRD